MKKKSKYEEELEYQIELVRAIDSKSPEREMAISLLEYARLFASGRLSRAERDDRIRVMRPLASQIKGDLKGLESFKWIYIANLLKGDESQAIGPVVKELCDAQFPFLSEHLTVTMAELQEKVRELRGEFSDIKSDHRTR